MRQHPKGFTLTELMVVVAIIALLAAPLYEGMRAIIAFWQRTSGTQTATIELTIPIPELTTQLQSAQSLADVSVADKTQGYIKYTDQFNRQITIFLNSPENQSRFSATNTFSTSNIMAVYQQGSTASQPEVLLDGVTSFKILTLTQDLTHIVTVNNTTLPNLSQVNAVQFAITRIKEGKTQQFEQLIVINKTAKDKSGVLEYGSGDSPFNNLDLNQFTYSNIQVVLDGTGGLSDGIALLHPSVQTVSIKNTGLYFSSIQAAINAASSGDTILVAYKSDGYNENISLKNKTNITIQGGYDSKTWVRNTTLYPTKIKIRGGSAVDGITACLYLNNSVGCSIDGLELDGDNLRYNVYITNSTDFKVTNTRIYNADRPILINNASGTIANNNVTSNEYAVYISSSKPVIVQRNAIFSKDDSGRDPAIKIESSTGHIIRNNIIQGGYDGVVIRGSTFITFVNNVVDYPENFCIYFVASTHQTVRNNAFCHGSIGLVMDYVETGSDIDHNAFLYYGIRATQPSGRSLSSISQGVGASNWEDNNPFFENPKFYFVKSGSVLIDAGANGYADTTQTPVIKGTTQNDIGAYGGGSSGRVGMGQFIPISTSFSEGQVASAISASFPSDIIHFSSGTYSFTQEYTLKNNQIWEGEGPVNTLINHSGSGYVFRMGNNTTITSLRIKGNGSNKAIIAPTGVVANQDSLILQNIAMGIEAINAKSIVSYVSMVRSDVGMRLAGTSAATSNFVIFSNASTGILNEGSDRVVGRSNLFADCSTQTSGTYSGSGDKSQTATQVFWDADAGLFSLYPTSLGINIAGSKECGALEYYELKGYVQTPQLSSNYRRAYKKIELELGGLASIKTPVAEVEAALVIGSKTVTLSPTIILKTDEAKTPSWNLPVTAFVKGMKIKVQIKTYIANRSAYLNKIIVRW